MGSPVIILVVLHVPGIMGRVRPIICLLGVLISSFAFYQKCWVHFLTTRHCLLLCPGRDHARLLYLLTLLRCIGGSRDRVSATTPTPGSGGLITRIRLSLPLVCSGWLMTIVVMLICSHAGSNNFYSMKLLKLEWLNNKKFALLPIPTNA
jgi:hypothetical protein